MSTLPPSPPDSLSPISHEVEVVYSELKRLAGSHIRRERADHTLSATGLVHEAYLRLAESSPQWESRSHFFGIAANAMRQVLVDHARAHRAEKRGGDWLKLTLTSAMPEIEGQPGAYGNGNGDGVDTTDAVDIISLNDALCELEQRDPRQAKIVELRYFGGLSIEDTAATLNLSPATIKREWLVAKLYLKRKLDR